jgi:hypothetical protein
MISVGTSTVLSIGASADIQSECEDVSKLAMHVGEDGPMM